PHSRAHPVSWCTGARAQLRERLRDDQRAEEVVLPERQRPDDREILHARAAELDRGRLPQAADVEAELFRAHLRQPLVQLRAAERGHPEDAVAAERALQL